MRLLEPGGEEEEGGGGGGRVVVVVVVVEAAAAVVAAFGLSSSIPVCVYVALCVGLFVQRACV